MVFYDGAAYPAASAVQPTSSTTLNGDRRGDNGNGSFLGAIDELSIYNRALSTAEIQTIYNANGSGKCQQTCVAPPAGLVSWPANKCQRRFRCERDAGGRSHICQRRDVGG